MITNHSLSELNDYFQFTKKIGKESGTVLKKYWGKLSHIQEKKFPWDLVTEADKESEEIIISQIKKQYPDHIILSEESGLHDKKTSSEFTWIIDPLDGTTNYTHQYPMVSVSIALLKNDIPIVGVVYNPIMEEFFCALHEQGCTLNDTPIFVSEITSLNKSLLATGFAYDRRENSDNNYAEFCHITHNSQGVRRGGSAALDLAYVAAGRLDGYWERGLSPWDIAAGVLLIQEAGGHVSSYEGTDVSLNSGRLVATNGHIHIDLLDELKKADKINFPKNI